MCTFFSNCDFAFIHGIIESVDYSAFKYKQTGFYDNLWHHDDGLPGTGTDSVIPEWGMFWQDHYGMKSCWCALYKTYFGMDINYCSDEQYKVITASEEFKNMNIFPDDDSAAIIDGTVVFKLTDNPVQP